jgi:hypothetical protein
MVEGTCTEGIGMRIRTGGIAATIVVVLAGACSPTPGSSSTAPTAGSAVGPLPSGAASRRFDARDARDELAHRGPRWH